MKFSTPRRILAAGATSLLAVTVFGAVTLSAAEDLTLHEGLWLSYSVVSTTGFGDGPVTSAGQNITLLMFPWMVASYVLILTGASFYGQVLADQRRRGQILARHEIVRMADELNRN